MHPILSVRHAGLLGLKGYCGLVSCVCAEGGSLSLEVVLKAWRGATKASHPPRTSAMVLPSSSSIQDRSLITRVVIAVLLGLAVSILDGLTRATAYRVPAALKRPDLVPNSRKNKRIAETLPAMQRPDATNLSAVSQQVGGGLFHRGTTSARGVSPPYIATYGSDDAFSADSALRRCGVEGSKGSGPRRPVCGASRSLPGQELTFDTRDTKGCYRAINGYSAKLQRAWTPYFAAVAHTAVRCHGGRGYTCSNSHARNISTCGMWLLASEWQNQ